MDLVEVKNRKNNNHARHPWELARFEIVRDLLKDIIKNDDEFHVLDIGCGDVFFISRLSELYPKAKFYAIDTAFTDAILLQLQDLVTGKNIFLFKTIEEANQHLKKKADLVLLLDVVEHIEDDHGFLKTLYDSKTISSDTHLMITVPAFQSLFCSHDHFLGHFRRYTNKTLLQTIENAGFRAKKIGYFFTTLIPPRIVQVIKEKISTPNVTQNTTGLVEWNKGATTTSIIKYILLLDYKMSKLFNRITGLPLIGLSNFVICKKPK